VVAAMRENEVELEVETSHANGKLLAYLKGAGALARETADADKAVMRLRIQKGLLGEVQRLKGNAKIRII
jgi:hypothetical protein